MKIGIVSPANRAVAWEEHLQGHQSISEVIISSSLKEMDDADACIMIDNSDDRLDHLTEAAQRGYHTFLVAPLPTDTLKVQKAYHTAEESNVLLQFTHWPTFAPASKWMSKKIPNPTFLQINREIRHTLFMKSAYNISYYWIDELAFCLRWVNSGVHHIDLKTVRFSEDNIYAIHLFLRFDNGATAAIYINVASENNNHHRLAADKNFIADCNVMDQKVRLGEHNKSERLYFKKRSFDASNAAELAALEFIKSVQLKRPAIYNGYHLLELAKTIDKIKQRLARA